MTSSASQVVKHGTPTPRVRHIRRHVPALLRYLAVIIAMVIGLFPFYWAFVTSLMPQNDLLQYPPRLIPLHVQFEAYIKMVTTHPILLWLGNSMLASIVSMVVAIAVSVFAGYSLSRFQGPTATFIGFLLLATRMIPGTLLMVPLYIIFRQWGILDSRLALVVAYTTFEIPFATWLLKGYFDSIPTELEQAAQVDGCSQLGAFVRVILPLGVPGLAAAALASFILAWSDYEFALGLINSQTKWTVPIGISSLFGENVIHWNQIMASSVVTILPVVVLFLFFQRYIVSGLTAGAVKA